MSGPTDPSTGRAVNANQLPVGEYAADCPTRMTSWAISIVPPGWGVTSTDGDGEPVPADGVGVGFGLAGTTDGLRTGVAVGPPDGVDEAVEDDADALGGALDSGASLA